MGASTLKEARAVVTQYHKYLSEHSLIKTVFEDTLSLPPQNGLSSVEVIDNVAFLVSVNYPIAVSLTLLGESKKPRQ